MPGGAAQRARGAPGRCLGRGTRGSLALSAARASLWTPLLSGSGSQPRGGRGGGSVRTHRRPGALESARGASAGRPPGVGRGARGAAQAGLTGHRGSPLPGRTLGHSRRLIPCSPGASSPRRGAQSCAALRARLEACRDLFLLLRAGARDGRREGTRTPCLQEPLAGAVRPCFSLGQEETLSSP